MLLRIILFIILGYLIVRFLRYLKNIFLNPNNQNNPAHDIREQKKEKIKINKDDIIDADFEELDSKKQDSSNSE
jgi:hypothetical protein